MRWATREIQALNKSKLLNTSEKHYKGVLLEPAGSNRRAHNNYVPIITLNGKHHRLGNFYILNNALRVRYDKETELGISHTFERPDGDLEPEPDYGSGHPGVVYSKERNLWRVYIGYENIKDIPSIPRLKFKQKYVGQAPTLQAAKELQQQALENMKAQGASFLNNHQRNVNGIIAIEPNGINHEFDSIVDFQKKMNTKANIHRKLKDGSTFVSPKSKFRGWHFYYKN